MDRHRRSTRVNDFYPVERVPNPKSIACMQCLATGDAEDLHEATETLPDTHPLVDADK
jgi:hypothetical protein